MRCKSIVGIWPETPPSHRVTAVAVLNNPPTLYTGAADGSVVWWRLSDDHSPKKIKPVALLCGHAAPIADLCISYPLLASPDSNTDHGEDLVMDDAPSNQGALLSACGDGVICVWTRGSGHCRRRRKLPPWVGSPSMLRMLPENRRYVCVASFFPDCVHAADHDVVDSAEGGEVTGDHESLGRRPPKCTIVLVDSCTLTIVQTVVHGSLSIGPPKFMAIVESVDENLQHSALMVDSCGKIQCVPLIKDPNMGKDGGNKSPDNSSLVNISGLENWSCEGVVVSVAVSGDMLGLVYTNQCIFILVSSAAVIGLISFENSALRSGADCNLSHVTGSMFLCSDNIRASKSGETQDITDVKFCLWNDKGIAVIYEISYVNGVFKSEAICEVPAISGPMDVQLLTNFVQLDDYFLRVESICCHDKEPFLWRPYITMWSIHKPTDNCKNCSRSSKLLGDGSFLVDWIDVPSCNSIPEAVKNSSSKETALPPAHNITGHENNDAFSEDDLKYTFVQKERIVSSTMVISQHAQVPYAVVYGYHSGEIELVQFNILAPEVDSDGINLHPEMEPQGAKQQFSGHTGPVLCLAAHHVGGTCSDQTCSQVLLSGSMDCTLRIWDLETGNSIMVMHHHVAPVRQIILPPLRSDYPWSNCFLSVGDDSCVALVSLETLRVERMFPGHPSYPAKVVWDGVRGYLACLSQNYSVASGAKDALYIWDIKAGSRERVLRGTAAHSMFNNFCGHMGISSVSGYASTYNTSSSSLLIPLTEDRSSLQSQSKKNQSSSSEGNLLKHSMSSLQSSKGRSLKLSPGNADKIPIQCSCPTSGIAIIDFDLSSLISADVLGDDGGEQRNGTAHELQTLMAGSQHEISNSSSVREKLVDTMGKYICNNRSRLCLLRFSLSFMHFWGVDFELDNLLMMEMDVKRYKKLILAPGLVGDRGSISLAFPDFSSILQLWKSSSEFCALRSLTMVSLAQSMVSLSHSCSAASSALSAFYTRSFAEKFPDLKPPSLQLLVSFWQNEDEHIRMAARSLFHCAASRAIPQALCCTRKKDLEATTNCLHAERSPEFQRAPMNGEVEVTKWLESYELQDWVSCVGGTSQDAMASHIIVAAALAIWYPSLVKPGLAMVVVHPVIKLVMAMNEKYSAAAAELLAEGMDGTWKECITSEIPRLIGDIFFQIECVSGASVTTSPAGPAVPPKLREMLVSVLLPSLAMADITGFLSVIEGLIWSTASDSPVHLASLKTLIRLMRGCPRNLAQYLIKVVNFILHTMDPANSVMRKTCLQVSMATLREVVRVYPMVALNDTSTRLAVGDAIAEVNSANIHVYDMPSVTKMKVLDASGPPGLPTLFSGAPETVTAAISALTFSPDGEGLVAFSENGLVIRWWSLGSAWWEKLSRNFVPVQCTKLILVPPWEGISPNSSRASIMAHIEANGRQENSQEHLRSSDGDSFNILLYNLDLSYKLEWVGDRKVLLTRRGQELGTFIIQ